MHHYKVTWCEHWCMRIAGVGYVGLFGDLSAPPALQLHVNFKHTKSVMQLSKYN
jgi:hypothetical protein